MVTPRSGAETIPSMVLPRPRNLSVAQAGAFGAYSDTITIVRKAGFDPFSPQGMCITFNALYGKEKPLPLARQGKKIGKHATELKKIVRTC
jgi:hypothetical protein